MTSITRHLRGLPIRCGAVPWSNYVPVDLAIVFLWALFGSALSGLCYALGIGEAVGQVLAAAG
jgi:hypothetical protein